MAFVATISHRTAVRPASLGVDRVIDVALGGIRISDEQRENGASACGVGLLFDSAGFTIHDVEGQLSANH